MRTRLAFMRATGLAAGLAAVLVGFQQNAPGVPDQVLSPEDVSKIVTQALAAAKGQPSLVRRDSSGGVLPTSMHIAIVDRTGKVVKAEAMDDAWVGSRAIAQAKAYTAMAFSSDDNALTTRSLGALSQPGAPLWNIGNVAQSGSPGLIEFPGGVPLYKGGQLVGAIGVSGDGVEEDENVAEAGAKGFEPTDAIRIDRVTGDGVPYTK